MNTTPLEYKLFMTVFLFVGFNSSFLKADHFSFYEPDYSGGWTASISGESNSLSLESTDRYLSGAMGTEDWEAEHDLDGDLHGFCIRTIPPIFGKRMTAYFSLRSGEVDGNFNTREVSPTPEGPYFGKVDFDRDEWELGVDFWILNAVYTRVEYSMYEMEGDWAFFGGSPNEPQEYEYQAVMLGLGFRAEHPINYILAKFIFREPIPQWDHDFSLQGDAFFGISYFEYKHTEKLTGASVDTDDIGYEGGVELVAKYKVSGLGDVQVFGGGGYSYKDNDGDDLDLSNEGFFAKIGVQKNF